MRYSIEGQELTDIADALRRKHGDTKTITVVEPVPVVDEVFKSKNVIGFGELDGTSLGNSSAIYLNKHTIHNENGGKTKIKYWVTSEMSFMIWKGKDQSGEQILNIPSYHVSEEFGEIIIDSEYIHLASSSTAYDKSQIGIYAEIIKFDADGNPNSGSVDMEVEKEVPRVYESKEMAQAIEDIDNIPPEAFVIGGNCSYMFCNDNWRWFLDLYIDKLLINTTGIQEMFARSKLTRIPDITYAGSVSGSKVSIDATATFQSCKQLRDASNVKFIPSLSEVSDASFNNTFQYCNSLRKICDLTAMPNIFTGNSIYGWTNSFEQCFVLDELLDLPVANRTTYGSYLYQSIVSYCTRLKNLTFRTDEGNPIIATFNGALLNLVNYVGYSSDVNYILNYNSGITADKEVKDDATYQALKDDPDWFTTNLAYSRYNHDSAVATINSLPDTSAYLASKGGTNTIKFKGEAGSATDGGAINTLTEEEIAVATSRGWTVSLA